MASIQELEERYRRRHGGEDPRAAFERRGQSAPRGLGRPTLKEMEEALRGRGINARSDFEQRYRLPPGALQERGAFEVPGLAYRREGGPTELRVRGRPVSDTEVLAANKEWGQHWGPESARGKRRAILRRIQAEKNRRWAKQVTARDRQIKRSLLSPIQRLMVQGSEREGLEHRRGLEVIEARRPRQKWGEGGPEEYEEKLEIESRYREPAPITEAQRNRATVNYSIAQDIINKYPNREDETAAIREAIERSPEITRDRGSPKAVRDMLSGYYGSIEPPEEPDELTESERGRADVNFAFANRIYKKFPAKAQRAEAIQEALTKASLITQQGGNPTAVLNMVKGFYSGSFVEDIVKGIEGIMAEQEKRRQGLR